MKIRCKFQKIDHLKFIGHLDVMRTFQKIMRRADIDIQYSAGFSPHQKMTFATPLGLGAVSVGEYMDIELGSCPPKAELIRRINEVSVPELSVLDASILPDDAKNAMSLLAAADYTLTFREGYEPWKTSSGAKEGTEGREEPRFTDIEDFFRKLEAFLQQPEILTEKKTKTSVKAVDLAKQIRKYERRGDTLFFRVDTGSASNLKPELVMETFWKVERGTFDPLTFCVNRDELYGEENGEIKALIDYGEEF